MNYIFKLLFFLCKMQPRLQMSRHASTLQFSFEPMASSFTFHFWCTPTFILDSSNSTAHSSGISYLIVRPLFANGDTFDLSLFSCFDSLLPRLDPRLADHPLPAS